MCVRVGPTKSIVDARKGGKCDPDLSRPGQIGMSGLCSFSIAGQIGVVDRVGPFFNSGAKFDSWNGRALCTRQIGIVDSHLCFGPRKPDRQPWGENVSRPFFHYPGQVRILACSRFKSRARLQPPDDNVSGLLFNFLARLGSCGCVHFSIHPMLEKWAWCIVIPPFHFVWDLQSGHDCVSVCVCVCVCVCACVCVCVVCVSLCLCVSVSVWYVVLILTRSKWNSTNINSLYYCTKANCNLEALSTLSRNSIIVFKNVLSKFAFGGSEHIVSELNNFQQEFVKLIAIWRFLTQSRKCKVFFN